MTDLVHATAVVCDGVGILIMGPAGSGKTDLALRLIDGGAVLVADDQVSLLCVEKHLVATCPPAILGLMEIKGIGVVKMAYQVSSRIDLIVELVTDEEAVPVPQTKHLSGVDMPCIGINAFNSSAPAKVRLAAGIITGKTEAIYSSLGDKTEGQAA